MCDKKYLYDLLCYIDGISDVWLTSLLAMKMHTYSKSRNKTHTSSYKRVKNTKMIHFLDAWYNQTLLHSTQDQVLLINGVLALVCNIQFI